MWNNAFCSYAGNSWTVCIAAKTNGLEKQAIWHEILQNIHFSLQRGREKHNPAASPIFINIFPSVHKILASNKQMQPRICKYNCFCSFLSSLGSRSEGTIIVREEDFYLQGGCHPAQLRHNMILLSLFCSNAADKAETTSGNKNTFKPHLKFDVKSKIYSRIGIIFSLTL